MNKLALTVLALTVVSTPALAVTYTDQVLPFDTYTLNVGGTFSDPSPPVFPPLFRDFFNFPTTYARNATVEITSHRNFTAEDVNFVSNGVKLNAKVIPATSTGVDERRYLANFRIPAGFQTITVAGSSKPQGSFQGILTLSGVPEPSTWAMMTLGLGFAGAAMRTRRRRSAKMSVA